MSYWPLEGLFKLLDGSFWPLAGRVILVNQEVIIVTESHLGHRKDHSGHWEGYSVYQKSHERAIQAISNGHSSVNLMGILAITRVILIAEKIVLAMRNVYLAIKIVMNNYQNGHIGHFKGISGHF